MDVKRKLMPALCRNKTNSKEDFSAFGAGDRSKDQPAEAMS